MGREVGLSVQGSTQCRECIYLVLCNSLPPSVVGNAGARPRITGLPRCHMTGEGLRVRRVRTTKTPTKEVPFLRSTRPSGQHRGYRLSLPTDPTLTHFSDHLLLWLSRKMGEILARRANALRISPSQALPDYGVELRPGHATLSC